MVWGHIRWKTICLFWHWQQCCGCFSFAPWQAPTCMWHMIFEQWTSNTTLVGTRIRGLTNDSALYYASELTHQGYPHSIFGCVVLYLAVRYYLLVRKLDWWNLSWPVTMLLSMTNLASLVYLIFWREQFFLTDFRSKSSRLSRLVWTWSNVWDPQDAILLSVLLQAGADASVKLCIILR